MLHGKRYRVTCDDLNTPRTKEGSYQVANEWWRKLVASLGVKTIDPERMDALSDLDRKIDYAANNAPDLLLALKETRQAILDEPPGEIVLDDDGTIADNIKTARLMGISIPKDTDPLVLQHLFGDRRLWDERLSRSKAVEKNRTIGVQLDLFLDEIRPTQKPQTHNEMASYLRELQNTKVWSKETDANTVDEQTVARHYAYLTAQNYKYGPHNKYLGFFRRFVTWLWTSKILANEPRNLKLRSHRKKRVHVEVRQFDGVREAIKALPFPHTLWAVLALNCGMTNADLGATRWDQIDTEKWILTRRRAKTGDDPGTPTVRYKLWKETITALQKLPSREGLLFTTGNGSPMYKAWYDEDGTTHKKDMFSSYWTRLDPKSPIPLGKFRSIGATALKQDKLFRQYADLYLGHAAASLTDIHYGAESWGPFFEATEFIHKAIWGQKKPTQKRPDRSGSTAVAVEAEQAEPADS